LTLLNDPEFVEASRVFAARVLGSARATTDAARLDLAYQIALSRHIKPAEAQSLENFLEEQRTYYRGHLEDAGKLMKIGLATAPPKPGADELAAWSQVCRVILNLHETITRY
jgi:hypothetical protein